PVVVPPPPLPETLDLVLELKGAGNADISISPEPEKTECESERKCTYTFSTTTRITVTATVDKNSLFTYWSGVSSCAKGKEFYNKGGRTELFMTRNMSCIANLKLKPHTLSLSYTGNGGGSVSTSPGGNPIATCTKDQCISFSGNTKVTLTPTPNPASNFDGWTGDEDCNDDKVTMDAEKTCIASFNLKPTYTLTMNYDGEGTGSVTGTLGTACGDNCTSYVDGTTVNLTPLPTIDSFFGNWSGDCAPEGQIAMAENNKVCTATFNKKPLYKLTLTVVGNGSVASASDIPATELECGDNCTNYLSGTTITLTPTLGAGSVDSIFSEDCRGGQVIMESDKDCKIVFTDEPIILPPPPDDPNGPFTLLVKPLGNGNGNIISGVAGIDCGSDCTEVYPKDTAISLKAIPDTVSTFDGWGGDCSDGQTSMASNRICTAIFTLIPTHTLTVKKAGEGNGTVSSVVGINCGDNCMAVYNTGTSVTLTATPAPDSNFAGWGDTCPAGQLVMDVDAECTTTFTLKPSYALTVTKAGPGAGVVTSNLGGINCGDICTARYVLDGNPGTVTLTPLALPGSFFTGWEGDCSNNNGQVSMEADKQCTAIFESFGVLQLTESEIKTHEEADTVTLIVSRLGGSYGQVSVDYATVADTALETEDYLPNSGTLTWETGDGEDKSFTVNVLPDRVKEENESLSIVLSNPGGNAPLGNPYQTKLIIEDVPWVSTIQFPMPTYMANEGDEKAVVLVTRAGSARWPLSVNYVTLDIKDGAIGGSDYESIKGILTWADGDRSPKAIEIPLLRDSIDEPDENFVVLLANLSTKEALFGKNRNTTVKIINTPVAGSLEFAEAEYHVDESLAEIAITVNRIGGSGGIVSVDYVTTDETAKAGQDYTAANGRLTWNEGDTEPKQFIVPILGDNLEEPDETVMLTLSTPLGGASLGAVNTAILTIANVTPPPESTETAPPDTTQPSENGEQTGTPVEENPNPPNPDEETGEQTGTPTQEGDKSNPPTDSNTSSEVIEDNNCQSSNQVINCVMVNDDNASPVENIQIAPQGKVIGGKMSGNIQNQGEIQNVTLQPETHITGGTISGHIRGSVPLPPVTSSGIETTVESTTSPILTSVTIAQDTIVEQVVIDGNIQNLGQVQNVTLLPDTYLVGGTVSGKISGPLPQFTDESIVVAQPPAILSNLTVATKTTLTHVMIGDNVLFEKEVILGEGVSFERNGQIPLNMDLASVLGRKATSILGQYAVNLSGDVLSNSAYGGILGAINGLSQLKNNGLKLTQGNNLGLLNLDVGEMRYAVLPMQVTQIFNAQVSQELPMGVHFDPTDKITFITHTGREVITHPVIQAPEAFNNTLRGLGLNEATMLTNGNFKVQAHDGIYYTARASLFSTQVSAEMPLGLFSDQTGYYFVFEDETKNRRQQYMYPAAADTEALSSDNYEVKIKYDGQIIAQRENRRYQGRLNYVVTKNQKRDSGLRVFDIVDVNGDGYGDYRIDYPNGDSQVIFHLGK
ncbi:Calx-beta domain-containing protein, partial [Candidatus Parabeggiatoa sp. HSG14]|uniref:Calx-beta domain-containing protein n=1 Tax=Candidatus Parabeggiatoa sp. HSG14 TaxID=3055593 RepID=UPI0025A7FC04|nr:Calx-beta domain-containing protein [Thiotrichales bacterium HSG14]